MKKRITLLFLLFITSGIWSQSIVINEVLASNAYSITDEDGDNQDWIELYNNGTTTVNLSGYGITDDATILYKWIFPDVSMAPGSYLLVWASDKNRAIAGKPLHTNFKVSSAGNPLILTTASGVQEDSVPAKASLANITYGRFPNGTGPFVFFENGTPNAVNSVSGFNELLLPPTFSQNGGFLTANFDLTLATATPGARIIYTLDGSDPDENNLNGTTYSYKNQYPEHIGEATGTLSSKSYQSIEYTAPIGISDRSALANKIAAISTTYHYNPTYIPTSPIAKGTVVRAKVVKAGAIASKIASKTYFITPQGNATFSLPVISISINEDKLFDYSNGIHVAGVDFDNWRLANPSGVLNSEEKANYSRTGAATEIVGNMNYFVNGTEVVNQDIGIRIHGGASRAFQSKGLNLYARSEYGASSLDYKFFSDVTDASFKRLILRNSGGDFESTMFRDALNQEIVKPLNAETEAYQPAIVFVNGEYWGILNIREKYDDKYFTRVYKFGPTDLDLLEDETVIINGDDVDYTDMRDYMINNSLAADANYTYIKTRLDPENLSDYFISNIFFQNADWPVNNIRYWRKRTNGYLPNAPYGHDGRWRWAFHDMDDTYAIGSDDYSHNSLADATAPNGPEYPNPAWSTLILRKMLENNTFKTDFINRFADLLNTTFLPSRILPIINTMKSRIEPEIDEHIARWKSPANKSDWDYDVNYEANFINARPDFQRDHIRTQFGITSNINTTLAVSDENQGYIKINTIEIKEGTPGITGNPYPWTGIYFNAVPIKLTAIAKPGFVFSNWSGDVTSTNAEITLTPTANLSITANFIPNSTFETSVPIHFWYMNGLIANNVPLETLNATYSVGTTGSIQYQSCLVGYPFPVGNSNRNKASMERRNSPTAINYRPEANANLAYDATAMKGLQIKQTFQNGGLENTMVLNLSTSGHKNIKLSFAAMDELAGVSAILIDYAVNSGTPVWITTGLTSSSLPLFSAYKLFEIDFTGVSLSDNNPDFKVRLRFTGPDMTLDAGNRVTFNNIAVDGIPTTLEVPQTDHLRFKIYPNPFTAILNVSGNSNPTWYKIFTVEGKLIKDASLETPQINLGELPRGMYLLQLTSDGKVETQKIIKR